MRASVEEVKRVRVAERDALLGRLVEVLGQDGRVVGAWAFGSLGRGTADAWSDVDLRVVVRDEALAEVVGARHEVVNRVGAALLEQDVPQNAPPGGAFRSAVYGGSAGLLPVDWTWRAYSGAVPPADVRMLFGEEALRRAPAETEQPPPPDERDPAVSRSLFFWCMCLVTAKYIARGSGEETTKMLGMVAEGQRFVRERLGRPTSLETRGETPSGERGTPREMLAELRRQCSGMEELLPELRLEELSPAGRMDRRYVQELSTTLDLVEDALA